MKNIIFAALMIGFGATANAIPVTIDFDEYADIVSNLDPATMPISVDPDFTFSELGAGSQFQWIDQGIPTAVSLVWYDGSSARLTQDDGFDFDLMHFESSLSGGSGTIDLIGNLAAGGTIMETLSATALFSDFELQTPTNLSAWQGLSSLDITFNGTDRIALDNFKLNVVPLPAAVWMFLSALGLLAWLRVRTTGTTGVNRNRSLDSDAPEPSFVQS